MTRKDYVLLAEAINEATTDMHDSPRLAGAYQTARRIASHLARDNKAFDRERFLKACGVIS